MSRVLIHIAVPEAYAHALDREVERRAASSLDRVSRSSIMRDAGARELGFGATGAPENFPHLRKNRSHG